MYIPYVKDAVIKKRTFTFPVDFATKYTSSMYTSSVLRPTKRASAKLVHSAALYTHRS